ncbi:MAG: M15 family metallopeptidase [SAR324 cluster bacterium]|nr:M15 family metallopeptidase [SAR324 cluster bacterium]
MTCEFDLDFLMGGTTREMHCKVPLLYEAGEAFLKMQMAAKKDGVCLKIISGHRDFNHQNKLWAAKYKKFVAPKLNDLIENILQYTALPGTSRHHWGTEIDLVDGDLNLDDPLLTKNYINGGPFYQMYDWLLDRAEQFNFYMTYPDDKKRTGFMFEPWHFSYQPLSKKCLDCFLSQNWVDCLDVKKIAGEKLLTAAYLKKYQCDYLLGINLKLL